MNIGSNEAEFGFGLVRTSLINFRSSYEVGAGIFTHSNCKLEA